MYRAPPLILSHYSPCFVLSAAGTGADVCYATAALVHVSLVCIFLSLTYGQEERGSLYPHRYHHLTEGSNLDSALLWALPGEVSIVATGEALPDILG